ncbi:MAG: Kdo hydroxylase family protein [Stenotrophobium sp.]
MLDTYAVTDWSGAGAPGGDIATAKLEHGGLLLLPQLPFAVSADERRALFTPAILAKGKKNVSYDLAHDRLAGVEGDAALQSSMHGMIRRYAQQSHALVAALFPQYRGKLIDGRTSFRPAEVAGRVTSPKKDDSRLHVDAFPATPVQGKRLLRVFSNINPEGKPRHWCTGEPFADVAARFATAMTPAPAAQRRLMQWLKITKSYRTAYDDLMLRIHDAMKLDPQYQAGVHAEHIDFLPGQTWIVYSDQVSHAAHSGQFMMEQTFYLPADAMLDPGQSPLRQLERLKRRPLLN